MNLGRQRARLIILSRCLAASLFKIIGEKDTRRDCRGAVAVHWQLIWDVFSVPDQAVCRVGAPAVGAPRGAFGR
jgi:hypothetical protein